MVPSDIPDEHNKESVPELARGRERGAVSPPRSAAPTSRNRGRALAIVCALGAIGAALLTALQTRAPGGFHWNVDIPFGLVFGGTFGAAVGALSAPLMGWLFFRHVTLGRAMGIAGAGTVAGAVVGLVAVGAPAIGGILGFVLSAVALRFHPRVD